MAGFDDIINAIIPWAIGIIGLYLLYRPLREPLSGLFSGIKGLFTRFSGGEEESGYITPVASIQYE